MIARSPPIPHLIPVVNSLQLFIQILVILVTPPLYETPPLCVSLFIPLLHYVLLLALARSVSPPLVLLVIPSILPQSVLPYLDIPLFITPPLLPCLLVGLFNRFSVQRGRSLLKLRPLSLRRCSILRRCDLHSLGHISGLRLRPF